MPQVALQLVDGEFAICRLDAAEPVPPWVGSAGFTSITRTADELSVVCLAARAPFNVRQEAGWRLLRFKGPFAFNEVGILAAVLVPLAAAKIPILAQSTFDTDYLLIKNARLDEAVGVLTDAGHSVSTD